MSLDGLGRLKNDLERLTVEFENTLSLNDDIKIYSLEDYEKAIHISLELQYKASRILSTAYRMIALTRPLVKKGQLNYKSALDELTSHYDYYKQHVYNFSQRAKVLQELLKSKQLASPDTVYGRI